MKFRSIHIQVIAEFRIKKNSLYAYMALSYIGELGNPIQSLGSRKYSDNNQVKCLSVHLFQITIRQ